MLRNCACEGCFVPAFAGAGAALSVRMLLAMTGMFCAAELLLCPGLDAGQTGTSAAQIE